MSEDYWLGGFLALYALALLFPLHVTAVLGLVYYCGWKMRGRK